MLVAGQEIDVFHRFGVNPNCPQWLATPTRYAGTRSPRFGQSDGWQRAVVQEDFDPQQFDPQKFETGMLVRYLHPFWVRSFSFSPIPSTTFTDLLVVRQGRR